GQERGLTAQLVRDFEQHVNRKYRKDKRPVTVYLIPTTRDKLLPNLIAGYGDIAAANLTITEARLGEVDFVPQTDRETVSEIVVTGPNAPRLASLDDLSGHSVHVRPSSSYHESLVALNAKLQGEERP